jgi:hypothetical protein
MYIFILCNVLICNLKFFNLIEYGNYCLSTKILKENRKNTKN